MSDTFRLSPTAIAARREREFLDKGRPNVVPPDPFHVGRVANAMMDYRAEHQNEPLARLWTQLALVALNTE